MADQWDGDGDPPEVLALGGGGASSSGPLVPPTPSSAEERPAIRIRTAEHEVNAEATKALGAHPGVYQRAGQLVRVVRDSSKLAGVTRPPDAPTITELPRPVLREHLTQVADWERYAKTEETEDKAKQGPNGKGAWVPAHPPDWCVNAVHARGEWPGVRALEAVAESPVLRPDGTILQTPGYDPKTGILYLPAGKVDRVPESPTREDALAARDQLLEVVQDFPFQEKRLHGACWLAGLLTPLCRIATRAPAPLFMVDANVAGSGKSMLTNAIAIIVSGRDMAYMDYADDNEEMRKQITTVTLAGDPLVCIDNINVPFGCSSIDLVLTGTTWRDRLLGTNERKNLPLVATWFATGNNIEILGDLRRRLLPVRLRSDLERPEERTGFSHPDLVDKGGWVERNRPRLLAQALTLLRAYVVAGRPDVQLKPWGSYGAWSNLVRAALKWVDLPDVADARTSLLERSDPEVGGLGQLLRGWQELDPRAEGVSAVDAIARLKADADGTHQHPPQPERFKVLRSAILELCPGPGGELPSPRSLGARFRKLRERSVGGLSIDSKTLHGGMQGWYVRGALSGDCGDPGDSSSPPTYGKF